MSNAKVVPHKKFKTKRETYTVQETYKDPKNHGTNNWLTVSTGPNSKSEGIEEPNNHRNSAQIFRHPTKLQNGTYKQSHKQICNFPIN